MVNQEFLNFLASKKLIDKDLVEEELTENGLNGQSFKNFLLTKRYISEESYQKALADFLSVDFKEHLPEISEKLNQIFVQKISHRVVYKHMFFPISMDDSNITFAISNLVNLSVYESVAELFNRNSKICLTLEANILNLIQKNYKMGETEKLEQDEESKNLDNLSSGEGEDLLDTDDDEPIRRLVNALLFQATKTNASDIHIDPTSDLTIVRNRIDGVLYQANTIPKYGHNRVINRVKVMSGLDISMRNVPQDGRTMIKLAGKKIDIRVSVLPTIHGERLVLRLLQQSHRLLSVQEIGLLPEKQDILLQAVSSPNGIILATGPTGSGKTTTLYSCLQTIDHSVRNVITIEDPVEYQISGYGQVQVNEKQGLTFASGLRSILRQDPDVIMVGEIRDVETAKIAIQSALTGHLVFSTLHTNDAPSTVIRLIDMGVDDFLISSTLKCVISQRLVRRLCEKCKIKVKKNLGDFPIFESNKSLKAYFTGVIYEEKGCLECSNTGYQGRISVHEILTVNDELRGHMNRNSTALQLRKHAIKAGAFESLVDDCYIKVFQGITSLAEITKLLYEINQESDEGLSLSSTGNIEVIDTEIAKPTL